MPGRLPAGLSRRKYAALLVLLLVVLAIETFTGAERLRSDALRAVLTVAIWIIVFDRPRERAIAPGTARPIRTSVPDILPSLVRAIATYEPPEHPRQ